MRARFSVFAWLSFLLAALLVAGCSQAETLPSADVLRSPAVQASGPSSTSAASQPTPLLLGLGDSVTAGFGASPGRDYFTLVKNALGVDQATNLSVSCSTSDDLERKQLPGVPRGARSWILVTTGGNDLIHNYGRTPPRECAMYGATYAQAKPWIAAFESRMERIVKRLDEQFPRTADGQGGCEIFLADIYDPTDGVGDIENAPQGLPAWEDGLEVLAAYNAVIAGLPGRHANVHVVGIRARFLGHGIHHGSNQPARDDDQKGVGLPNQRAGNPYWFYTNLEDPNDLGYAAISEAFLEEMTASLRR